MTPCKVRLGNDDIGQERDSAQRIRMRCGPDGGDSTVEDEDAPERATLRLYLSAKQTLDLTERC